MGRRKDLLKKQENQLAGCLLSVMRLSNPPVLDACHFFAVPAVGLRFVALERQHGPQRMRAARFARDFSGARYTTLWRYVSCVVSLSMEPTCPVTRTTLAQRRTCTSVNIKHTCGNSERSGACGKKYGNRQKKRL